MPVVLLIQSMTQSAHVPLDSDNSYNATYFKTSLRPPHFTCTWARNELAAQHEAKDAVKVYVDDWTDRTKARWDPGRKWQGQVQLRDP